MIRSKNAAKRGPSIGRWSAEESAELYIWEIIYRVAKRFIIPLPKESRSQLVELFRRWPGVCVDLDEHDWMRIDCERVEYLKYLLAEIKCPPVEFCVAIQEAMMPDYSGDDLLFCCKFGTDWHKLLAKGNVAWNANLFGWSGLTERAFDIAVRRLAWYCCYTKGIEPRRISAAVNYDPKSKASAFVKFTAAVLSSVPLNSERPERSWPAFSKKVSIGLSKVRLCAGGT
jgi:hypothetical protein